MLFNSLSFALFLPLVFGLYWLIGGCGHAGRVTLPCRDGRQGNAEPATRRPFHLWHPFHLQNLFVVAASYVFYGWWDWKFLLLITFTSVWAWASGIALDDEKGETCAGRRKFVVALALVVNLGILGVFKYYNFFLDNAVALLNALGFAAHPSSLQVILPVGISFYTFQALSYVLDVSRGTIKPTRDLVAFLAYVSFFPLLVAGPIERATNLLPQFLKPRRFDYGLAVEGSRQMLWGFFKKIFVADTCAAVANEIFTLYAHPSSLSIWAGVLCFTFQIYGDFSGYSDIAIGCSKLFGIRAMRNFNTPYFARDIAEFWRRWHISLTTWFRDYLYIPLGGSRCGKLKKIRNTFAIFLVSGFWHGANWTFVAWGAFHAVCFLPLLLSGKNRRNVTTVVAEGRRLPSAREAAQMLVTFLLVVVGWTFFRAPDISTAFAWLSKMLTFCDLEYHEVGLGSLSRIVLPVAVMLVVEWISRGRDALVVPKNRALRWLAYWALALLIVWFRPAPQAFIYFQF